MLSNASYKKIRESFDFLFPELTNEVADWKNDGFDKEQRYIKLTLKNGVKVNFGTFKDDSDGKWTWSANLDVSDKRKEELALEKEE